MSINEEAYSYISECNEEFYFNLVIEAYDLINIIPYILFYINFQMIGLWGIVFKKAISLANIFKYSYLGFQHIYSAYSLSMYQEQNVADHYANLNMLYGIGPNLGVWRCKFFQKTFGTYHWIHSTFFSKDWKFWFIKDWS